MIVARKHNTGRMQVQACTVELLQSIRQRRARDGRVSPIVATSARGKSFSTSTFIDRQQCYRTLRKLDLLVGVALVMRCRTTIAITSAACPPTSGQQPAATADDTSSFLRPMCRCQTSIHPGCWKSVPLGIQPSYLRVSHRDRQCTSTDATMGSKYGTIVMGPAGAGKTTFCSALIQHLKNNKRSCFYINLDPAAEDFVYEPDVDIKDLITLEDVMEELHLGPNGGLIYCFEFLLENLDFLTDPLEDVGEEYLIIIDMPGQIELYTHVPIVPNLIRALTRGSLNISMCAAYLLESNFIIDRSKFFSGTLSAMSAMLMLELPHVNVLSKMDLVKGQVARKELKRFIDPDISLLQDAPESGLVYEYKDGVDNGVSGVPADARSVMVGESFARLNRAVAQLIDDFSLVSFLKLDAQNEDSVNTVLSYIDDAIQFHEAQEPKEPNDELAEDEEDQG
nr:gpn-loop gtpase 3 [Quercus suber]